MNKTSYSTRFSYAASDVAGQLLFCWVMWYVPYFYTDTYKISAATVGTILLVARWMDAIDAPIWGVIFDRTRSRWGKSRPWFLWLCVPFATFGVLTFLTPDLGHTAKVAYAAITYIGCNVLYTGINTPVTSILSALTADPRERVTLTTFRMLGSKLGVLIVNLTALSFVNYFSDVTSLRMFGAKLWGLVENIVSLNVVSYLTNADYRAAYYFIPKVAGGDDRIGFMLTVPIFALVSVALFLTAFRNLKEVIPVESKPQPIRGTFGAIKGNWPWLIIFTSSFLFWIGFISRVTVAPHFFKYVLHRPDLLKLANGLDFASLATAVLLPWFCRKTSKRNVWALGLAGMVLGQLIVWLGVSQDHSVGMIMAGWTVGFVASGAAMAMPFSVLSDSVDYGEWKTGIRAAGLLTAIGAAFCLKAGAGFGGALPMWIIDAAGYAADVEQTPAAMRAIECGIIWVPAVCLTLSLIPVLFYGKFERLEPQIHAELDQRRAQAAAQKAG